MNSEEIKLSQQLIRFPSYSGMHHEVIQFLDEYLTNLGFNCEIIAFDGDDSYPVNNLHAVFNPNNSDKVLFFAGHTDIVKEGNKSAWKHDPFAAKIENDKLYGRGAADMKCAIACFMVAVKEFLKENPKPNFGIGFLITNDEEADSINGTKKVLHWMEENDKKITHCIVGEPTNPNKLGDMIKVGRRGSVGFNLKVTGKQGHVAYPDIANNPITILNAILKVLKDHKFDEGTEFFDPTNLEITSISSPNLGGNVIPNEAEASFNVRFNDIHSGKSVVELVDYVCQKSMWKGSTYDLKSRISGEAFLSKPGKLAEIISDSVEKICSKKPELSTSGGTSDARFIKNFAEVVEIGLVNQTAHKIDEFSEVEEIKKLKEVYLGVLRKF